MTLFFRVLTIWAFLTAILAAQTPTVNAARSACRGNAARIYAELPIAGPSDSGGASTVMVPVCLQLGPLLTINATTDPPTLTTAMVQQQPAWLAVDRIDLATLPASTSATLQWTLGQVPVEGSALLAILQGRPFGLVEAAVTSGRQVNITLPARPFQPGDVVVLVYLTTDPRPVSRR